MSLPTTQKNKERVVRSASGAVETCGPAWSNITDTPRALRNVGAVEKKLVTLTLMVLWSCALSSRIFNRESRDQLTGRHTKQLPPFPVRVSSVFCVSLEWGWHWKKRRDARSYRCCVVYIYCFGMCLCVQWSPTKSTVKVCDGKCLRAEITGSLRPLKNEVVLSTHISPWFSTPDCTTIY